MFLLGLFCRLLLILNIPRITIAGFTSGAPCSQRNTAILDVRGPWRMPKDRPNCVDITAMGRRAAIPPTHKIVMATTLYADRMHLKTVPDFVLTLMPNLHLIDFSSNHLRRMSKDAFLPLRDLDTLLLENNHVVIPKHSPLLNSPSLGTLSLSNNKIRRLRLRTFREVPALAVLYLDRNYLVRLNPNIFAPLKHLKYLHLGNNRLKVLPSIVLVPSPKSVLITKGNPLNSTGVVIKR